MGARVHWGHVLDEARSIVASYDTPVTLRQLFYRLVAAGVIDNSISVYKGLSRTTARARRAGTFPALVDFTREVHRAPSWRSPAAALGALVEQYRLDRTRGQEFQVWLGVEKATMVAQLVDWYDDLGLPVVPLRGYSSQSYVDDVADEVERDGRLAVLLYAGDWDPSGEDILRDFLRRTGATFATVEHVALTPAQVAEHGLPIAPGKRTDSRAAAFVERHGQLAQVELEALDPARLHGLYDEALAAYWDTSTYEAVMTEEAEHRVLLDRLTP
jgi:hypothetical protein